MTVGARRCKDEDGKGMERWVYEQGGWEVGDISERGSWDEEWAGQERCPIWD